MHTNGGVYIGEPPAGGVNCHFHHHLHHLDLERQRDQRGLHIHHRRRYRSSAIIMDDEELPAAGTSRRGAGMGDRRAPLTRLGKAGDNHLPAHKQEGIVVSGYGSASGSSRPKGKPMIGNINSPSVSMASVSSDGSAESHVVEPEEMVALTQELKRLKEALGRLKKVFQQEKPDAAHPQRREMPRRVASHERLSEVLKILRQMLEKYPMLQSNEIVSSAERLIQQVKNFDYDEDYFSQQSAQDSHQVQQQQHHHHQAQHPSTGGASSQVDPSREFHEAIEALAHVFSNRVSEYIMGDLESVSVSSASSKTKSSENLATTGCRLGSGGLMASSGLLISGSANSGGNPAKGRVMLSHSAVELDTLGMIGSGNGDSGSSTGSGARLDQPGSQSQASGGAAHHLHSQLSSLALVQQQQHGGTAGVGCVGETLTADQIDGILMRHDQGVDHALMRAKIWSKYAKDVMSFVEKRTSLELEWARNLTKLAQTMRPLLKEESYLPFQSIYCTALDHDLEMCATTQATGSLLHGFKFLEPLAARRNEHEKVRKSLKDRWQKELKRIQEAVSNLRKAKTLYTQRMQEYERCREALRIAEQGAEIGATGENKVDKRKRLEEDALAKTLECEASYRGCVVEANDRHRSLLVVKAEVLQQVRELILQCDQTMKAVTVSFFHLQYTLTAPVPTQFQTLCDSSRLYEPGFQYMEYVKRLPDSSSGSGLGSGSLVVGGTGAPGVGSAGGGVADLHRGAGGAVIAAADPFHFEPYDRVALFLEDHQPHYLYHHHHHLHHHLLSQHHQQPHQHYQLHGGGSGAARRSRYSLDANSGGEDATDGQPPGYTSRKSSQENKATYGPNSAGPLLAWTPSVGPIEPSDTESVESDKSSPSAASPMIASRPSVVSNPDPSQLQQQQQEQQQGQDQGEVAQGSFHQTAGGGDQGQVSTSSPAAPNASGGAAPGLAGATAGSGGQGPMGGVTRHMSITYQQPMIMPPSSSSVLPGGQQHLQGVSAGSSGRRQLMSKAAITHHFRKLKTPSKCRECDSYVYFQGYECHDCGLSSHKKCLETLALQCGHKRLPRRMTTFGVDLSQHLQETGAQVPPLVCKCVHEIDTRGGVKVKGIYRVSGVKHKVEKLCQDFENGAELVDLTDINPNVIANVLKLYMRQLPEPLLTFSLYPEFIRVAETYPSPAAANNNSAVPSNNSNNSNAGSSNSEEQQLVALAAAGNNEPEQAPHDSGSKTPQEQQQGDPLAEVLEDNQQQQQQSHHLESQQPSHPEQQQQQEAEQEQLELQLLETKMGVGHHLTSQQEEAVIAELQALCRRLPRSHLFSLGFLMHHLHRVASEHEANNMTASNLAIVFGPTLLRRNETSASLITVMETIHQARAVELLTIFVEQIFGPPENVLPKDYARYTTSPHQQLLYHPHHHHHHHSHPHHVQTGLGSSSAPLSQSQLSHSQSSHPLSLPKSIRTAHDKHSSAGLHHHHHYQQHHSDEPLLDDLHAPHQQHFMLPGQMGGSTEDLIFGASVSDDDDSEPIPAFLLPDGGGCGPPGTKPKLSPLLYRPGSSPPKIIKQSLKNFSGLEGVTPGMLSTQDSLEVGQKHLLSSVAATAGNSSAVPPTSVMLQSSSLVPNPRRSAAQPFETPMVTTSSGQGQQLALASQQFAGATTTTGQVAPHPTGMPPPPPVVPAAGSSSSSSASLFAKVGRSAKKHSLDEEFFVNSDGKGLAPAAAAAPRPTSHSSSTVLSAESFSATSDQVSDDQLQRGSSNASSSSPSGPSLDEGVVVNPSQPQASAGVMATSNRGVRSSGGYLGGGGGNNSRGIGIGGGNVQGQVRSCLTIGGMGPGMRSASLTDEGGSSGSSSRVQPRTPQMPLTAPPAAPSLSSSNDGGRTLSASDLQRRRLPQPLSSSSSSSSSSTYSSAAGGIMATAAASSARTQSPPSASLLSSSTIPNLEENRVKIQVPGIQQQQQPAVPRAPPISHQKSIGDS